MCVWNVSTGFQGCKSSKAKFLDPLLKDWQKSPPLSSRGLEREEKHKGKIFWRIEIKLNFDEKKKKEKEREKVEKGSS